jgi:eukaryotic-like serine/threonine-protein kinase
MPIVDRARWRELEPLLDEALELTPAEQQTWIAKLRTTSPDLAAEVERLLAGDAAASAAGFLSEQTGIVMPDIALAGVQVGAYTLERPLGEGGMGWVWLARRTDGRFDGVAAVKLLNVGLLTPAGQERFRREGSALARLAHPGIARLLDAGVATSGQPYLVLEHIEGEPADAFVANGQLTIAQRIELVLQVLAAIGHAHANLIVHRDIKPSNILVTADGTAKLLDFGIAKLLSSDALDERTSLTIDGQRALTPEFAAPEQIEGGDITTATDIYGVGALLYVLLTGHRPFDLGGRSLAEVRHVICEVEAPRPSHVAAHHGEHRLVRELRGDLDAIVMKALRKEPARRYASAAAFADDLRRIQRGQPVIARPDSVSYRTRKFVRRHRGGVVVAAAIPLFLSGAVVRERGLRARAEQETRKARAVEEYLVNVFDMADPYAPPNITGEEVTARALLDRGAARVDSALADQPQVQAELHGVLGRVYTNLAIYDKAVPLLRRALEQQRAQYGERSLPAATAMVQLGMALTQQSQYDEAERLLRDALAIRRSSLGNTDTLTARALTGLGMLLQEKEDLAGAERTFEESLAIMRRRLGPSDPAVGLSMNDLGVLQFLKGDYDKALANYRGALAIQVAAFGENHPKTAQVLHNLAQTQELRGELGEAEVLYRRALASKRATLGNAHPSVTINLNNLGAMLIRIPGKVNEAEPLIREALALDRQMFGERHTFVAASLNNLGNVLRAEGRFREARESYQESLDVNLAIFGAEHNRVALDYNGLGMTAYLSGDFEAAIPPLRKSFQMYSKSLGEQHLSSNVVGYNLAKALRDAGHYDAAETILRRSIAVLDTGTTKSKRAQVLAAQGALGGLLTMRGRPQEAVSVLEPALAAAVGQLSADDAKTADIRWALGITYAALQQRERAIPLLQSAYAVFSKNPAQRLHAERARIALRALGSGVGT